MAIQKKQMGQGQGQGQQGAGSAGIGAQGNVGAQGGVVKQQPTQQQFEDPTEDPTAFAFDMIAKAKGFSAPEPGTYEAIMTHIKINPLNAKGVSAQADFVVAEFDDDGQIKGTRFTRYFKLAEADGRTPSTGSIFHLTKMLAKLGYERNQTKAAFEEINEQQPGVSLKLTENGQYPPNSEVIMRLDNDNENIQALREWIEANPF